MQALSRLLQYGARSEASGLSGNGPFISCLSSPQKTMVECMCVCVWVGHVPKCDFSACRHDEHMILCVCVCPFISICTSHIICYSERFKAEAAMIFFFFFFYPVCFPLCAIFLSYWLSKQSRTAKCQTWALGL